MLSSRLRKLFPHDSHAVPDGSYQVISLYFDTPYDTALREKLDGVDRRGKNSACGTMAGIPPG